jgi:hypothetical protein
MQVIVLVGVLKEEYMRIIIRRATASTRTELQRRSISHQAKPREKLREGGLVVPVVVVEVDWPARRAVAAVNTKSRVVKERSVAGALHGARKPFIIMLMRLAGSVGVYISPSSLPRQEAPPFVPSCWCFRWGGCVRCVWVGWWGEDGESVRVVLASTTIVHRWMTFISSKKNPCMSPRRGGWREGSH